METNLVKDVFNRYNVLITSKNTLDTICNKMNAEFHASFYCNKGAVWMSYNNEQGKPATQKLS